MEQWVVFWIRRDDGRGERWKCDWSVSGGRGGGRNNTVQHWVRKKDLAGSATHVVVFTEGARWRTGRWPDAIVADDKGEEPRLRLTLE